MQQYINVCLQTIIFVARLKWRRKGYRMCVVCCQESARRRWTKLTPSFQWLDLRALNVRRHHKKSGCETKHEQRGDGVAGEFWANDIEWSKSEKKNVIKMVAEQTTRQKESVSESEHERVLYDKISNRHYCTIQVLPCAPSSPTLHAAMQNSVFDFRLFTHRKNFVAAFSC